MKRLFPLLTVVAILAGLRSAAQGADVPAEAWPAAPEQPLVQPAPVPAAPLPAVSAPPVAQPPAATESEVAIENRRSRPQRFGNARSMVFTGSLSASFGFLGYNASPASTTSIGIQPAFDYFLSDGFSLGASIFARYSSATSGIDITDRNVAFGFNVEFGSNLWLTERVSLWTRFYIGAWQSRSKLSGGLQGFTSIDGVAFPVEDESVTENIVDAELFAPVLFHLARHFFVGMGPDAYIDIYHSIGGARNNRRFIGASSTVGGWF